MSLLGAEIGLHSIRLITIIIVVEAMIAVESHMASTIAHLANRSRTSGRIIATSPSTIIFERGSVGVATSIAVGGLIMTSTTAMRISAMRSKIGTRNREINKGLTLFKANLMIKEMDIKIIESDGLNPLLNSGDK